MLQLRIRYEADQPFAVEVFAGKQYRRLGVLAPQAAGTVELPLAVTTLVPELAMPAATGGIGDAAAPAPAALPAAHEEYGSGEARIIAVKMYDQTGRENRVFEVGKAMRVELEFTAGRPLRDPVFAFCVYHPTGLGATQWLASARQMGTGEICGRGRATFSVNPLQLGRGSYVASAAIFKHLRKDGAEPPSYHVLDRCVHFQVVQAPEDAYEKGICVQPFVAELCHE